VEQGCSLNRPRDQVRASGELVVLEWLVDPNFEAETAQARCFCLAHGCVDGVGGTTRRRLAPSRVGQLELGLETERDR
jgi:hypothetical protein